MTDRTSTHGHLTLTIAGGLLALLLLAGCEAERSGNATGSQKPRVSDVERVPVTIPPPTLPAKPTPTLVVESEIFDDYADNFWTQMDAAMEDGQAAEDAYWDSGCKWHAGALFTDRRCWLIAKDYSITQQTLSEMWGLLMDEFMLSYEIDVCEQAAAAFRDEVEWEQADRDRKERYWNDHQDFDRWSAEMDAAVDAGVPPDAMALSEQCLREAELIDETDADQMRRG